MLEKFDPQGLAVTAVFFFGVFLGLFVEHKVVPVIKRVAKKIWNRI